MYELIIIGGGPAGVAAGIYAARKKIRTLLATKDFAGQSITSADVQNWIGMKSVSGFELSKMLEDHLKHQEGIEIKEGFLVSKIEKSGQGFKVFFDNGDESEAKTILLAMGSRPKKLNIPGEEKYTGKGVFYCATCDAPLMKNKVAAVIGGGNSGLEAARDLLPYASKIYVLEFLDSLKGDCITQENLKASGKVEFITSAAASEIYGEIFVKGLKYQDRKSGETKDLAVEGVFVEIGFSPNSEITKDLVELDKWGHIVVDHQTQKTSLEGVWAAGDISDVLYKQNNIAAGDAIKAVLNIHDFLGK